MSGIDIEEFIVILEKNKTIQMLDKGAKTPDQIIQIAESAGIDISMKELRFWSRKLKAPYFPWVEKENQWRREFFAGIHDE